MKFAWEVAIDKAYLTVRYADGKKVYLCKIDTVSMDRKAAIAARYKVEAEVASALRNVLNDVTKPKRYRVKYLALNDSYTHLTEPNESLITILNQIIDKDCTKIVSIEEL